MNHSASLANINNSEKKCVLDKDNGLWGVCSLASEHGIIERLIGGEFNLQTPKIVTQGG